MGITLTEQLRAKLFGGFVLGGSKAVPVNIVVPPKFTSFTLRPLIPWSYQLNAPYWTLTQGFDVALE